MAGQGREQVKSIVSRDLELIELARKQEALPHLAGTPSRARFFHSLGEN